MQNINPLAINLATLSQNNACQQQMNAGVLTWKAEILYLEPIKVWMKVTNITAAFKKVCAIH